MFYIFSGFAVGSLIGGILYKKVGGAITLRIFSILAAFSALMYFILHNLYLKDRTPGKDSVIFKSLRYDFRTLQKKIINFLLFIADTRNNVEWRKPDDAQKHCVVAET